MKVSMFEYEAVVAAIGAANDGIVTAVMAAAAGLPAHALRDLAARGVLVPIGRGVYRLRDHPFTHRSRCRAALGLAGEGGVIARRSAARLHGFPAYGRFEGAEVLISRGGDHRTCIGRVIETRWLPTEHIVRVDGLEVTSTARTFFDLCADPDPGLSLRHPYHERSMARVYNDALGRRGMTFTQEAAVLAVLARRGRPGTRLVRRLLLRFGPQYEPTGSDVEFLFLTIVQAHGLPEPKKQVAVSGAEGWIGTVDFLWSDAKLIVEIDSVWHDGPLDQERDAERDERFSRAGYAVKRYRYGRLVAEPEAIARELAAALDLRGR